LGSFKIVQEKSAASGIRRIEALVGDDLLQYYKERSEQLQALAKRCQTQPNQIAEFVEKLLHQNKALSRERDELERYRLSMERRLYASAFVSSRLPLAQFLMLLDGETTTTKAVAGGSSSNNSSNGDTDTLSPAVTLHLLPRTNDSECEISAEFVRNLALQQARDGSTELQLWVTPCGKRAEMCLTFLVPRPKQKQQQQQSDTSSSSAALLDAKSVLERFCSVRKISNGSVMGSKDVAQVYVPIQHLVDPFLYASVQQ
jgi:hypothetical protein